MIAALILLSLYAAVITTALMATRVRLREVSAHDQAVTRWAVAHGGTGYMPYDGDEQGRGHR